MDWKRTVCFVPVQAPAWFLNPRDVSLGAFCLHLSAWFPDRGRKAGGAGRRWRLGAADPFRPPVLLWLRACLKSGGFTCLRK